jgi:uncharacterized membrane protein YkgB
LNIIKKTALYFARTKYCRQAIAERADLSAMREKPTTKMMIGLGLVAFSYVIGLPAVIAMGILAVWLREPLVGIIGGPLIYAISTIIFIVGIKMAGKRYFHVFSRWLVRVVLEKILGEDIRAVCAPGRDDSCP